MANEQFKPTLLSTAVAAGLMATAMPADALKLTASGQINKVIQSIDNGEHSALGIFDNISSGTRIRFRGTEELDNGLTVGGYYEWQMSNTSSCCTGFNGAGEFGQSSATFSERHFDISLAGGFGKVSLGQGNGAANGTFEVDLSGTWQIDYTNGNPCLMGGVEFGSSGINLNDVYTEFDGESRNQRIRYDTPKIGDVFSFAVSLENGGHTEFAGRFDATVGSTQIAGAIGSTDRGDNNTSSLTSTGTTDRERSMLSASLLLGNGLNFTIASSSQSLDGDTTDDAELTYFKVGYKKGVHAFSVSTGESEGFGTADAGTETQALAYVYTGIKQLDLYAGYGSADNPEDGLGFTDPAGDDITRLSFGARLKWKN